MAQENLKLVAEYVGPNTDDRADRISIGDTANDIPRLDADAKLKSSMLPAGTTVSPVTSVAGDTGDVVLVAADITDLTAAAVPVADAGNKFTATDVEGVLAEIDARLAVLEGA